MYILYAFLGALMASIGTIFAKVGLKGVDSSVLTALRGITMALVVSLAAFSFGKLSFATVSTLTAKNWFFVIISGLAGALSWMFFFYALSAGPTVTVTVIDKLSIVFTALFAVVVLSEGLTLQAGIGLFLVVMGTMLVAIPWNSLISLFK